MDDIATLLATILQQADSLTDAVGTYVKPVIDQILALDVDAVEQISFQ